MKKYLNKFLLLLAIGMVAVPRVLVNDIVTAQGVNETEVEDTAAIDEAQVKTIQEKESGLVMKVPKNLSIEGYKNENPQSYIINWNKSIILSPGEVMTVSAWNRDTKKEMNQVFKQIKEMDRCANYDPASVCIINFPAKPNEMSVYSKYFRFDKSLIRITYSFTNLYEVDTFRSIANSIKVNDVKQFKKKDYKLLNENKQTRDSNDVRGATRCGGLTDSNNPYNCCSSSISGQHNANCTWYAAYKRPDLKGIITQWPEGLFNQAVQAGVPTSYNQPVPGALIVWQLHVAYVESVGPNSVTWSEQNCYTHWYKSDGSIGGSVNAFNPSVTKNTFTPDYGAGNFLGYILPTSGSSSSSTCSGTNISKSNWNHSGPLSCTPVSSIRIDPESNLLGTNGDINIKPN